MISSIYSKPFVIPATSIDENGHVNNVAYVQWMQDIAVEHYSSIGGLEAQGDQAIKTITGTVGASTRLLHRLGDCMG